MKGSERGSVARMPPTLAPGKVCYLQIPARDPARAADFYASVFGWTIRRDADGRIAFDDTVGEVSGTWVSDRAPAEQPGRRVYILVESVERALERIVAAGGEVVVPLTPQGPGEAFATFRDPDGNVLGVGQQP